MDKLRGAVGGSACTLPASMEGPGFHPLEAGRREATWGYGVQPGPEADLATSHWPWRSCWRSPGLRCAAIKRRRSWRKNRPTEKGDSESRPCQVTARRSTHCPWTLAGSWWRKASPPAPATWLRTCCCPWPSWKGRSLFQGVPTAPPSLSSALRSLSSQGWCWVFGQDHLPYEEAHCLWWAASDHLPTQWGPAPGVLVAGGGEILVGPQWGETVCSSPCSTALPSNLGTAAYVMATTAAVRAFVLVIVLQVVRTGRWATFLRLLFTPTGTLTLIIGKLRQ